MGQRRIHRAVTGDGVEIAGRVVGQGPPLVFIHGAGHDGEIAWGLLTPHVRERFTCFLPSTRGRGLSGDGPDHSVDRLVDDVAMFVDSINEPVGMVGHSAGGALTLRTAARSTAVSAAAVYEPPVGSMLGHFDEVEEQLRAAVDEGRTTDAVEIMLTELVQASDEELAAARTPEVMALFERNMPATVQDLEVVEGIDRSVLAQITAPVLLLQGADSALLPREMVAHYARELPSARVVEIPGGLHSGPQLQPAAVAEELTRFFARDT